MEIDEGCEWISMLAGKARVVIMPSNERTLLLKIYDSVCIPKPHLR